MTKKNIAAWVAGAGAVALTGVLLAGANAQDPAKHGKVAPWDAMKSAAAKVPGSHAYSATYLTEGNKFMYDVIVIKGKSISEVEVDATTGKVGDVEAVTPEMEGKEMASDLNTAIGNKAPAKSAGKAEKPEKGEKPD